MSKTAMFVELDITDIPAIAWAAGAAAGSGNEDASKALTDILGRIQMVEIPDEYLLGKEEQEGAEVIDLPVAEEQPREVDPRFDPANFTPPPPMNNPTDFGAGPPPGGGPR